VRAAAGLENMEFHELKHFAAWYMLNVLQVRPDYIVQQLAHSDAERLFGLYGHPEEDVAIGAIHEAFEQHFGGNVRPLRAVSGGSRGEIARKRR
jgi:hypothetical protein